MEDAPNIAHLPVARRSEIPCTCGRTGCLTSVAGRKALTARAVRAGLDVTTAADITELAKAGNPKAKRILRYRIEALGEALVILMDVFSPDKIVLAGAIGTIENDLELFRAIVATRLPQAVDVENIVVPTSLGDATTANIVAAATPSLADFYDDALTRCAAPDGQPAPHTST